MLTVGEVRTKVGFVFDRSDADKFERREAELRRKARNPIEQKVAVDADTRGLDRYERRVRDVDHAHGDLLRGTTRVRAGFSSLLLGGGAVFAAGSVAAYGLAKGVGAVTGAFEESNKIAHQTDAVLKSTGGAANVTAKDVDRLATSISRKTGVDDEAIASGENLLLTFTNVRNEVGKGNDVFDQATRIATDMSVALGQDLKSSNIQLGMALNDPIKGVTALQRVGVSFTKQQREQIKTLVEHGKTVDAQKLILGELTKEFGGSAAAQATWSDKLRVTWGNLQETIGAKLAPALQKAGTWLNHFLGGLMSGTGEGGRFVRIVKDVAGAIREALGSAFGFITRVIGDNRKTLVLLGRTFSSLWADAKRYFGGIRAAISDTFGSGSGTGRDIRQIVRVLGQVAAVALQVYEAIVRRALPGIVTAFRGFAQIVRGVVKVIAGILTLDFDKAWDGVKDIFGGAIKAVGGILRAGTAPIRAAAAALGHVIVHALEGLPGALLGLGKRAVSALGRGLAGIPGAIAGAFKGGGSFLGNIGRGIADWLNAHTPFGDSIKVGPIHVKLPALRRGGKAGPGEGGPAVVYGEGAKDEWWISQEGDRRKNIGWAVEALQSLTGKGVAFFKAGGKKTKTPKKKPPKIKPVLAPTRHDAQKRSVRGTEAGIKDFERDIARMERRYDQKDREYGQSEEVFVIEHDDGSTEIDSEAIAKRSKELGSLHALRQDIKAKYEDYKAKVEAAIAVYTSAIKRLTNAIKAAKGSKRQKERSGYLSERQGYSDRVAELRDLAKDLDLDIQDQVLDLGDIDAEKRSLVGQSATPAPAPDTGPAVAAGDTADPGTASTGDGSSGDTGTTGTTDTGPAPPSALDIAAAALADIASFNASRQQLFASFGGNFASRESLAALLLGQAPSTAAAAGLRAFGATPPQGTSISITNNFGGGPAEPGTWAAQQRFAVEAQMG